MDTGVPRIPQSSCITEISRWNCLISYPGILWGCSTSLQRYNRCILLPLATGQPKLDNQEIAKLGFCIFGFMAYQPSWVIQIRTLVVEGQWWSYLSHRRCPWYNYYRHRKWTRWHEFKFWTWLIAFHIALIPLGKVWIQLFSLQPWVNSRAD